MDTYYGFVSRRIQKGHGKITKTNKKTKTNKNIKLKLTEIIGLLK